MEDTVIIGLIVIALSMLAGDSNDSPFYRQSFEDWQKEFDDKGK